MAVRSGWCLGTESLLCRRCCVSHLCIAVGREQCRKVAIDTGSALRVGAGVNVNVNVNNVWWWGVVVGWPFAWAGGVLGVICSV